MEQTNHRKVVVIVQARMGSERLPGKVLRNLNGKPMLHHIVRRISQANLIDDVVIATTDLDQDNPIVIFCRDNHVTHFRGDAYDVLDRYWKCAEYHHAEIVVRLTADNPFVDPSVIDEALEYYSVAPESDYLHYHSKLPLGVAVEIISFDALRTAWQNAPEGLYREHVTPYIYMTEGFNCLTYDCPSDDFSNIRLTVDTEEDFATAQNIYEALARKDSLFSYREAVGLISENPSLVHNRDIKQKSILA